MPARDKYTDPELRDEIKEEVQQGDKGGAPGQWSARKAQMMASEYKKRGGGYTTDKKDQDESQKHLSKWTEEEWQTKEGSAHTKQEDGSRKRYLPKKAWENMSEKEKKETDEKKLAESKEGKQHVQNTEKAKASRRKANKEEDENHERKSAAAKKKTKKQDDEDQVSGEEQDESAEEHHDDAGVTSGSEGNENGESEKDEGHAGSESGAQTGKKRGRPRSNSSTASKKQKSNSGKAQNKGATGSKKQPSEPPAEKGSKDRVPKKGQKVHWKSLPGYIEGEVVEIVYEEKDVDGKKVKGAKDDPRIVLKSSSSGKIAAHKPEAVFFD